MPKACQSCGTDNRVEALFCRRCGTPFSSEQASPSTAEPTLPGACAPVEFPVRENAALPIPPATPPPDSRLLPTSVFDDDEDIERTVASGVCRICGAENRPAAASCGNCGAPMGRASIAATASGSTPLNMRPSWLPPGLSSPSEATWQPAAGLAPPVHSPSGEQTTVVVPPPPSTSMAAERVPAPAVAAQIGAAPPPTARSTPAASARRELKTPGSPSSAPKSAAVRSPAPLSGKPSGRPPVALPGSASRPVGLWLVLATALLLLLGLGYWLISARSAKPVVEDGAPPSLLPASGAPVANLPAAGALEPVGSAPDAATPSASAPGSNPTSTSESVPASSAILSGPLETAAASAAASPPVGAGDDAARLNKQKIERAAHAKALREIRDQAAGKKAEQNAAAQRSAEDKARSVSAETTPASAQAPPLPATIPQSAQAACAGRGMIGTAVCESRECGKPEHAAEARCRQVNAEEERRR